MRRKLGILITAVALATASAPFNAEASSHNGSLKAAIIYNFTRFSSWPSSRFAGPTSNVVLCVAPDHPLNPELLKLEGRPVGARRLHVRRDVRFDAGCHAAVLMNRDVSPSYVSALNRQGVLTVGETSGFALIGAIGLVTVGRQVRFEINNRIATAAGVELSSKLLRLAIAVR